MIMNAFVFLYLKLTRNWWSKELKWNYMIACVICLSSGPYRKKISRGNQSWKHRFFRTDLGRKIVYLNLFPTHKIFRKILFQP